jgi:hypothetical protein
MKRAATEKTINVFLKAVYPEMTEFAIASKDEEEVLRDATEMITSLTAKVAALEKDLEMAAIRKTQNGMVVGLDKCKCMEKAERLKVAVEMAITCIEDYWCECYDEYGKKRPNQCARCSTLNTLNAALCRTEIVK